MEIWLDSINAKFIQKAKEMGILHGVTTNPSLLANSEDKQKTIQSLFDLQDGPVTVQVTSKIASEMITQGLALEELSEKMIVKIPVTQEGLKAIHALSAKGVETMATVIFTYEQYLLAAKAGAVYAAPYYSAMVNAGLNVEDIISRMCYMRDRYGFPTKILAASLQTLDQIKTCIDLGVDAITLKDPLFEEFTANNGLTLEREKKFLNNL